MNIEAIKKALDPIAQAAALAALPDAQHEIWKSALRFILAELEPKKEASK